MSQFTEYLRQELERNNMAQIDLASKSEVVAETLDKEGYKCIKPLRQNNISHLFNKDVIPQLPTLFLISQTVGTSLRSLIEALGYPVDLLPDRADKRRERLAVTVRSGTDDLVDLVDIAAEMSEDQLKHLIKFAKFLKSEE